MTHPILATSLMQARHDDLLGAAQQARLARESRTSEASSFSVRRPLADVSARLRPARPWRRSRAPHRTGHPHS